MMFVVLLVVIAVVVMLSRMARTRSQEATSRRAEAELAPVKKLTFEEITALGVELQGLDLDLAGRPLDDGARADYQRALDSYEAAKEAGDAMTRPDDVRHVTQILEDGRYAMACVRARVAGEPLPARRPPCFFDPRHAMSVADVPWTPSDGAQRDVPACALDAERVRAGAEPDIRQVMVGSQRVPYWQGGRAYQPYANGYFGSFGMMDAMFMGLMFEGMGGGLGALGDGLGGLGDGLGDAFDGIGDVFDGFDF